MSQISGVGGYNSSLLPLLSQAESGASDPLLSQAESGLSDPSLLDSLVSGNPQTTSQDADASSTATGGSSSLQTQIQSAVSAALQGAEQSGGSDLKGVVYNALVQVLQNNGIDPKTLQPTAGTSGSQQSIDSSTSAILAQVMAAVSAASAASDPAAQLMASQDATGSSDSLAQSLALENDSQGSTDLSSLLSAPGSTSQNLGGVLSSQNNNQDLLGFLFDSGQ